MSEIRIDTIIVPFDTLGKAMSLPESSKVVSVVEHDQGFLRIKIASVGGNAPKEQFFREFSEIGKAFSQ